jgi:hypothetical protein
MATGLNVHGALGAVAAAQDEVKAGVRLEKVPLLPEGR